MDELNNIYLDIETIQRLCSHPEPCRHETGYYDSLTTSSEDPIGKRHSWTEYECLMCLKKWNDVSTEDEPK